jgi:CubicO group peptidase (beta-lactamase class C family)
MDRTVYEPDYSDPRLAKGYTTFALSPPEVVAPEGRGWLCGAGGIYSTPTDLAKWNLALMNGQVLKAESLATMTAPRKLTNGRISEYGCGLSVKTQSGRQVLSHNGAVSGFNASSAMIPSTRSSVIMMCNLDGGLGALPGQVFALLLKEPTLVPSIRASPAAETVRTVFSQIQRGKIDRQQFGEEFNLYLSDARLTGASKRLKSYGTPRIIEVLSTHERGGMEVSSTRLTFSKGSLLTLMYRMPDGKIEQFFVSKD